MTDNAIATVGDLIAALTDYDPTAPVRVAHRFRLHVGPQNLHCVQHNVEHVVSAPDNADDDSIPPTDPPVVWLGIGEQAGYLPAPVTDALGWS